MSAQPTSYVATLPMILTEVEVARVERISPSFVRVELASPELADLGPDGDAFAVTMQSASCARARVLRCVYEPDLLTLSADLSTVAGEGGRVIVSAANVPADRRPGVNQRIVLRDTGLAKAAVVRQLRDDGDLVVDVVGDRVRLLE